MAAIAQACPFVTHHNIPKVPPIPCVIFFFLLMTGLYPVVCCLDPFCVGMTEYLRQIQEPGSYVCWALTDVIQER